MANMSLVFDLLARDNASQAFRNVGNAAQNAGQQGQSFGTRMSTGLKVAAGALAGAGLVEGFKSLYDAAAESAKIGRLTESVIRSTGGAANVTAKQVGDLAGAISGKTGVDDEAIQSGANLLLTFTNLRNEAGRGNDIFDQATKIMTDMSVALGTDASGSALQLGKALNDPIKGVTALTRVGVSFTESQKDQIKTLVESGRTMDAQKIILAELSKEFGGAAEAASTPFEKLQVQLGNLAEQVGAYLIPVVDDLSSFFTNDLGPAFSSAADVVGGVLGPALSAVGNTVKFLVEGFGDLAGPLQLAVIGFGGWALAGGAIMATLRPLGAALGGLRGAFSSFGQALGYARANGDGLGTVLRSAGSYAGGEAVSAFKRLGRAIGPALGIGVAIGIISELVEGFKSLTQASDSAKAAAEGLANALTLSDKAADRRSIRKAIEDTDGLIEVLQKAGVSSETAINGLLGQKAAQDQVNAALQRYIGTVNTRGDDGAESVRQARMAYNELATGYGNAAANARFFGDSATSAGQSAQGAADATTAAAQQTVEDAQAAQDALQAWIDKLAGIADAFVDPLGTYKTMLQESAQATADATASEKDSWQDFADSATVSLDQYAQKLEEQITNQQNWQTNLGLIAARAGADVAQQLAEMGVEGAGLVAQMANSTDAEMQRMADLLRQDATLAGSDAAAALDTQMKVMAAIGAQGATATAQGIATQLGIGVSDVVAIARQYGANLAGGINPILASLGKPPVMIGSGVGRALGQVVYNARGGLYEDHQAEIAPGGAMRVWAEPETGGEAYIPLSPSKRSRSLGIWRETGRRLQAFANGGFAVPEDVPHPPSLNPYTAPISTAGDAAMDTIYGATTGYVRENGPWGRALAWARTQIGKPYIWGGVGPAGYDCSGLMSAITNVLRGRSPYSRVGATATFPWPGFVSGDGVFTVGSTKNAGGGIGHMAGTLLGVNVESRGGQGVVVGTSARGAHNSLFTTRAHLAMAGGGVIGEPVSGIGMYSGRSYSFGERGPETVTPGLPGPQINVNFNGPITTQDPDQLAKASAARTRRALMRAGL